MNRSKSPEQIPALRVNLNFPLYSFLVPSHLLFEIRPRKNLITFHFISNRLRIKSNMLRSQYKNRQQQQQPWHGNVEWRKVQVFLAKNWQQTASVSTRYNNSGSTIRITIIMTHQQIRAFCQLSVCQSASDFCLMNAL